MDEEDTEAWEALREIEIERTRAREGLKRGRVQHARPQLFVQAQSSDLNTRTGAQEEQKDEEDKGQVENEYHMGERDRHLATDSSSHHSSTGFHLLGSGEHLRQPNIKFDQKEYPALTHDLKEPTSIMYPNLETSGQGFGSRPSRTGSMQGSSSGSAAISCSVTNIGSTSCPALSHSIADISTTSTKPASQEARDLAQSGFERYLAGQSVMKSGLTRDPAEVSKIIAEASVGSKFYMREKAKDEELQQRCRDLVKLRDRTMKHANVAALEKEANNLLTLLEAGRDLTQVIVHVDMDAFYANVEVKRDPSLKGKSFGVGHGVLTTASYEARAYGCRSGMAGFVAKKLCPHLILVDTHFPLYTEASGQVREVLEMYDENLCMAGMDEGYLNITSYMRTHGLTASSVVSELREAVHQKTGLTISAGIAPNTMLAKICSDKNKPNGQFELPFEGRAIRDFMRELPIRRIPGIGRVMERVLGSMGIHTCGDIFAQRAMVNAMDHHLGLRSLLSAYLGLGSNVVQPGKREERKSVGCERTFREKSNGEEILETLNDIAEELEKDLKRTGFAGRTVTVKFKLHTYEVKTRQTVLPRYVTTAAEILPVAKALLVKELPLRIRLLGIRMNHLKDLQNEDTSGLKLFFRTSPKKSAPADAHERNQSKRAANGDSAQLSESDSDIEILDDNVNFPSVGRQSSTSIKEPRFQCPICLKKLRPGANNAELNMHIDDCLQNSTIPAPLPKKRKAAKNPALKPAPKKPRASSSSSTRRPADAFQKLMKGS